MIRLTRLDRRELVLNCDLIASIESSPDTTLHLVTGRSQVVRESVEEVLTRIREWRTSLIGRSGLASLFAHPLPPLASLASDHGDDEDALLSGTIEDQPA